MWSFVGTITKDVPKQADAGRAAFLKSNTFRFTLLQFFYWMGAAAISFTVVFLQEKGLSPSEVGATMASLNVCAIIAPPILGDAQR